jgi:hypothetical protein
MKAIIEKCTGWGQTFGDKEQNTHQTLVGVPYGAQSRYDIDQEKVREFLKRMKL